MALKDAVIAQLNIDDETELAQVMADASTYGASGGVGGFIYYHETEKFYHENASDIHEALAELDMSKSTGDFEDFTQFANWMAWFALEHVAHEYVN